MKILLIGHALCPNRGSEPGTTWNWAWHLSTSHRVWVLAHPEFREEVDRCLAERKNSNLHVIWVTLPNWRDPWKPTRGERGIRLHYILWQRMALRTAARLHNELGFDLIHYVSWNTISAPPPLWRLPVPSLWGPLGGGMTAPLNFVNYLGSGMWREFLRTLRVRLLPWRPALRKAVRRYPILLATNQETARVLKRAGARDVRFFLDVGIEPEYPFLRPKERQAPETFRLLWAGRLEARKALPLALESLAQVRDQRIQLMIAGNGPLRAQWEKLAQDLALNGQVQFLGFVPWKKMTELYRSSDAFLFSSLRDSSGTVVLEAMAHALPIITLDHQGVRDFVPRDAGIKVPVTTPAQTVSSLAAAIALLANSSDVCRAMGEAAQSFAKTQTWDLRAKRMSLLYEEVLAANPCMQVQKDHTSGDVIRPSFID